MVSFIVSVCNGAVMLEFAEEALDAIAIAIEEWAERRDADSARHRLDAGPYRGCSRCRTWSAGVRAGRASGGERGQCTARAVAEVRVFEGFRGTGYGGGYEAVRLTCRCGEEVRRTEERSTGAAGRHYQLRYEAAYAACAEALGSRPPVSREVVRSILPANANHIALLAIATFDALIPRCGEADSGGGFPSW